VADQPARQDIAFGALVRRRLGYRIADIEQGLFAGHRYEIYPRREFAKFERQAVTEPHIDPNREQFDAFKALPRGAPIAMLNLVRYRERAAYPDGHDCAALKLTGAEAYARYGAESGPIFRRVGGSVIWSGAPRLVLTGPADEAWDTAFVALYPNAHAFLEMVTDLAYRLAVVHRQAAVATSRLIRCEPREAGAGFA
jgi:uncharacterized protein (DUF1330 family)